MVTNTVCVCVCVSSCVYLSINLCVCVHVFKCSMCLHMRVLMCVFKYVFVCVRACSRAAAKAVLVLLPILGLTWLCGVLVPFSIAMAYIFILLNSLQVHTNIHTQPVIIHLYVTYSPERFAPSVTSGPLKNPTLTFHTKQNFSKAFSAVF